MSKVVLILFSLREILTQNRFCDVQRDTHCIQFEGDLNNNNKLY